MLSLKSLSFLLLILPVFSRPNEISWTDFRASFTGEITTPGSAGYSVDRWNDDIERPADTVVFPADANSVAKALVFAASRGWDLAVRSGGHGSTGASSSKEFVVDLSTHFKGIQIDNTTMIAKVQPAVNVTQLEVAAIYYGLAPVTGLCGQVGVGGLMTGGGLGLSVGQYGLSVDNVVGAQVALANGTVVNANANENSDLFWGIRGGGSNFGVVTEYEIQLHRQQRYIYACALTIPYTKMADMVTEFRSWRTTQRPEEFANVFYKRAVNGTTYFSITLVSNGSPTQATTDWARFNGLAATKQCFPLPYEQFAVIGGSGSNRPGNKLTHGAYVSDFDLASVQSGYNAWYNLVTTKPAFFADVGFELYNLDHLASIPSNAVAFAQRSKDLTVVMGIFWTDTTISTKSAVKEAKKIQRALMVSSTPYLRNTQRVGYSNYADGFATDNEDYKWSKALFAGNYARLQTLKAKYDPDQLFHKWFKIEPLA